MSVDPDQTARFVDASIKQLTLVPYIMQNLCFEELGIASSGLYVLLKRGHKF